MQYKPRILISSVSCWNSRVGSNTLSAWLSQFECDMLANLYIREEVPDSNVCNRYFKISETKVIKSVFFRGISTGKKYTYENNIPDSEDISNLNIQRKGYYYFKKIRLWIFLYLREILWKLGNWKTNELNMFLDDFKPDIVVIPLESYIHFNRINQYIIKRTGAKAIGVLWDDNFTYKTHKWSLGFRIHRFFLRRCLKDSVDLCSRFISISPQMKVECDRMFDVKSIILTKPVSSYGNKFPESVIKQPIKMIYTGNLLIGRDKSLIKLLKALNKINCDEIKISLDIYTTTILSKKNIKLITKTPGCVLQKAIPQNEVINKQKEADVLLFLEALGGKDKYSARLSFSTKLTDYFSTGKCIFAIGPQDIAPIEYLKSENAAIISSNYNEIERNLEDIISNPTKINVFAREAFECGRRNHSENKIRSKFSQIIEELFSENNNN